jgi:two-component system chemotaxis sensor kinase CheA
LSEIEKKITIISEHYKGEELDLLLAQVQGLRDKPLKELLSNYPDMAQKIANKLEKSIYAFEIEGDKDLKVPQKYKPFLKSLVHVFRNSIDHGIEDLDYRVKEGKDEIGSIKCQFSHLDDKLILEISDDGKGIDVKVLKEKAISSGKLSFKVAEKLTHKEQLELIFVDSVSTKESVNELSGRGIGLGAVKAELERLGGVLEIKSEKGKGTTFTFKTKLEELGVENANV